MFSLFLSLLDLIYLLINHWFPSHDRRAQDFEMVSLFPRSGAKGRESLVHAGNDVMYGRQGRIESVGATEQFGDVETNDLSEDISNLIETETG